MPRPRITCADCARTDALHHAHGLCINCYHRQYLAPVVRCPECGTSGPHGGRGLCVTCYGRMVRTYYRPPPPKVGICSICREKRALTKGSRCSRCYQREYLAKIKALNRTGGES